MDTKQRLVRFYEHYAPEKLPAVDQALQKYAGREAEMFAILEKKYGPENWDATKILPNKYHDRVERLFQKYAPDRVSQVDAMLQKYAGKEEEMIKALVSKLGPEPPEPAGATSPAPSAASPGRGNYHDRVERLFQKYAPDRVSQVDAMLQKYAGKEEEMIKALVSKLGPEPPEPAGATSPAPSAASPGRGNYHDRVERLFQKYAPDRVSQVDAMLQKYAGKEEEMIKALVSKLGPEPPEPAGATSPAPSAASPGRGSYHDRVERLFQKYAPDRVSQVDAMLQKYAGKEEEMIKALVSKLGPEPPEPAGATSPAPSAASPGRGNYHDRVERLFQKYAPDRVSQVDAMLQKYAGKEEEMIKALVSKLGPEPPEPAGATSPAPSAASPGRGSYHDRVERLFQKYAPDRVSQVDAMLQKYAGKEEEMIKALVSKLGPEPPEPAGATSPAPSAASPGRGSYHDRVERLFQKYAPDRVSQVDAMLQKYAGKEEEMIKALVSKLGPEPPEPAGATSPAPSAASPGRGSYHDRVERLFQKYAPDRVSQVDAMLQKYAGKEEEMIKALVSKLGPEPPEPAGATSPAPSAASPGRGSYHDRVERLFQKYAPDRVSQVDAMLQKYAGKEEEMIKALVSKLGPEPPEPAGATSPTPSAASPGRGNYHDRVERLFQKYAPDRVSQVDAMLQKYAGKEEEMIKALVSKLGPEPAIALSPQTFDAELASSLKTKRTFSYASALRSIVGDDVVVGVNRSLAALGEEGACLIGLVMEITKENPSASVLPASYPKEIEEKDKRALSFVTTFRSLLLEEEQRCEEIKSLFDTERESLSAQMLDDRSRIALLESQKKVHHLHVVEKALEMISSFEEKRRRAIEEVYRLEYLGRLRWFKEQRDKILIYAAPQKLSLLERRFEDWKQLVHQNEEELRDWAKKKRRQAEQKKELTMHLIDTAMNPVIQQRRNVVLTPQQQRVRDYGTPLSARYPLARGCRTEVRERKWDQYLPKNAWPAKAPVDRSQVRLPPKIDIGVTSPMPFQFEASSSVTRHLHN